MSRNPETVSTGFPLPDQVEGKHPGPLAGFRGNDKAHRRNSRTSKIARLAAKTEKTPNDDRQLTYKRESHPDYEILGEFV